MAKQARFAFEFCAIEAAASARPAVSARLAGVETVDKIMAETPPRPTWRLVKDLCNTMKFGSLCALGGFTPYPVMSALHPFPRGFPPADAAAAGRRVRKRMTLIKEIDYGTPASKAKKTVTLTIDGAKVTVPEGTSIMRAAMQMGTQIPKLCATDSIEAFGSCRLCLVEIDGRNGTPASCTTPVMDGLVVHTQSQRLKQIRRGVMELYISDHPLDCLTCAANGDCELQDMAGASACATCATATRAPITCSPSRMASQLRVDAEGREQPLFHL
jgi:hypothetical protein